VDKGRKVEREACQDRVRGNLVGREPRGLERCYLNRFSKPELQLAQQINVGTNSPYEVRADAKLIEELRGGYQELRKQ
jgi:hypothetical protein